jgi:hypothetical protein
MQRVQVHRLPCVERVKIHGLDRIQVELQRRLQCPNKRRHRCLVCEWFFEGRLDQLRFSRLRRHDCRLILLRR